MKPFVVILILAITVPALYGSTTESSMDQIRQLLTQNKEGQAAQTYFNAFILNNNNNNVEQMIESLHALLDPIVYNDASTDLIKRYKLNFLVNLIGEFQKKIAPITLGADQLANFSYRVFYTHRKARPLSVLHLATEANNINIMEKLLAAGAYVDATDELDGRTPLMVVANAEMQGNFVPAIQLLLKYNADPLLKDKNGQTARDFALAHNRFEIAELLEDAEVKAKLDIPDKSDFNREEQP